MIWQRETGAGGSCGGIRLFRSVPRSGSPVRAVPLAAVIPSRVPAVAGGAWGGSASGQGGQAGSIKWAPAPPGEGGGADNSAASRLAAGQGKLIMRPVLRRWRP
jgi:hypothetical protein